MYKSAKSCITTNGAMSDFFTCNVGVRQGENLSPLLFAVYLNDFEEHIAKFYPGLKMLTEELCNTLHGEELELFFKVALLVVC